MTERVPDLLVEKLVLGELSDAQAASVRERLGDEADERIGAIKRSNAEILEHHTPAQMAAMVQKRLEGHQEGAGRKVRGWWYALPTLAAAAGVLLWVGTRGVEDTATDTLGVDGAGDDGPEVITLKGDARLVIQRRRGGEDLQVVDGDSVRAGDLLQVSYHSGGAAQGVIVSLDGAGVVTLHHPAANDAAAALAGAGTVALPNSYELDDAPGYERFFFVTGDDLDVDVVMRATDALGKSGQGQTGQLELGGDWAQSSVLLTRD